MGVVKELKKLAVTLGMAENVESIKTKNLKDTVNFMRENAPFKYYTKYEWLETIESQQLTVSNIQGDLYGHGEQWWNAPNIGDKYLVIFNGKKYECVGKDKGDGWAVVGNLKFVGGEDTGEPFLYYAVKGTWGYFVVDKDTSPTVSMMALNGALVHTRLDGKFMPTNSERLVLRRGTSYYEIKVDDEGNLKVNQTYNY